MTPLLLAAVLAQTPTDGGLGSGFSKTPPPPALESPAAWTFVEDKDGVRLESRDVSGSPYVEYRATTTTDVAVDTLCLSILDWGSFVPHDEVNVRRLLAERDGERVVYDQVQQAVVSNRDYARTTTWALDGGHCTIRFWATNDVAPPLPKGTVRMERLWGGWNIDALDGGTRVQSLLFNDPAGSLPPFLVRGPQKDGMARGVKSEISRARGPRPKHP